MKVQDYESFHKRVLESLIVKYPKRESEIRDLYNQERKILEEKSSIKDFIPILTYRIIKQVIRAETDTNYRKRKRKDVLEEIEPKKEK
jgi:protein tyrosine phosphatase (PTP) superfamily phosphohydrolase (DUF442 family)